MREPVPLSFGRASEQVEGMIQQGAAFARVEDAIDAARLPPEDEAALWLLAWSLYESPRRGHAARVLVAAFERED